MKKLLFIFTSLLISISVYSEEFVSKKYKLYDCGENKELKRCTNECSLMKDEFVQFKFNNKGNKVTKIKYTNGLISSPEERDNCTFANNYNWICEAHISRSTYIGEFNMSMINKLYTEVYIELSAKKDSPSENFRHRYCGVEAGYFD